MLPSISPNKRAGVCFTLKMESIEDLFYDGNSNIHPSDELARVQTILDANNGKMQSLFFDCGEKGMNRRSFHRIVSKTVGDEALPAADEIFSCCTNLYNRGSGYDTSMSSSQFAGGVVRLAHLSSLMHDGMVETSEIATQTDKFFYSLYR
mmetsp:Transcript_33330/g.55965  ORF Transcript_33330/g.55965 Transcript_33330/m.55965 type:complete len:150 (-) Transcript_33330:196-645(-)